MQLRRTDPETGLVILIEIGPGAAPALAPAGISAATDENEVKSELSRTVHDLAVRTGALGMDLGVAAIQVIGVPADADRAPALGALARALEWLGGRVLATPGPLLAPAELEVMLETTDHLAGLPVHQGGSGDPSPWTAMGVFSAIKACIEKLDGVTVGILGVGRVGGLLAGGLKTAGATVFVADTDEALARSVAKAIDATVVSPEEMLTLSCDVLSPNARGPVCNDETIPKLNCRFIAGAANGQLEKDRHARMLKDRGIVMVPEEVAGAGWLLNLATELVPGGYKEEHARVRVARIEDSAAEVLRIAAEENMTPSRAAEVLGDRWRASG